MNKNWSRGALVKHQQHAHGRRLSAILAQLAREQGGEQVSVGELMKATGDRAFGALMFALAAPIVLPIPIPGISLVLGVPLILLSWQLMIGRRLPFLPAPILRQSFDRRSFSRVVCRILPWLERGERLVRPRHLWIITPKGERCIGFFGFVLSLALFVPIPFANMLPALALAILAVGILERDGRIIFAGGLLGVLGIGLLSGVAYGFITSALTIARTHFGT